MAENIKKIWMPGGYQKPTLCAKCGGVLVYRGLGEYQCEECEALKVSL